MKSKALKNVLNVNGVGIIGMYLVVFIGLSIACPNFLKFSNIMIGIRQAVYTAIVAFAMTFVISLGGIDLSVGSTVGISGMVLAAMILGGYNIYLAIGVVILLGAFIGLVNGLLVTKLRIAYFIATLGTMSILRGLIYVYTKEYRSTVSSIRKSSLWVRDISGSFRFQLFSPSLSFWCVIIFSIRQSLEDTQFPLEAMRTQPSWWESMWIK